MRAKEAAMTIELTDEQQRAVEAPPRVVSPRTQETYVLVRAAEYERMRSALLAGPGSGSAEFEIPPGIRRSQEALRRDLPQLLENKRLFHQWAAYHDDERIGIARTKVALLRECVRRGLRDDEYYIGWIDYTEMVEEEELDPPPPGLCVGGQGSDS
jgi:hypothetical protein